MADKKKKSIKQSIWKKTSKPKKLRKMETIEENTVEDAFPNSTSKGNILKLVNHPKSRKILIFSAVSIFAIQSLISITHGSVNFALADDWPAVFAAIYFQQDDHVWKDSILSLGNEHLLFFYRGLMMSIFLINSYNVFHINILNWGLLVSSVILFYYILKKNDSRLIWLIIPISAFVFSPKASALSAISSVGLIWILTFFFTIFTIAIFAKEKISKIWFLIAIFIAIFASFTSVLGLLTWVIGIVFLAKSIKQNRNYLIIWILIFVTVSLFFYVLADSETGSNIYDSLTIDGFLYSLEYISNPFTLPSDLIKQFVGFIIISSIFCIAIFLIIKKVRKSFPWIILFTVGILFTIFTTIGRFGVRPPDMSYFIIMSTITEIALLALFSILFLQSRNFKNNELKNVILVIFVAFIVIQLSMLGTTYAYDLDKLYKIPSEKIKDHYYYCFDLPSNINNSCLRYNMFGDSTRPVGKKFQMADSEIFTTINFFIAKRMMLFSENGFWEDHETKRSILIDNVSRVTKIGFGYGDIQTINDYFIIDDETIHLEENFVKITGWMWDENNDINSVVLFVDDVPFLFSKTFWSGPDIAKDNDMLNDEAKYWGVSFFPAYLEDGCHDISVKGISGDSIFSIEKRFTLCIDSPEKYYPGEKDLNLVGVIVDKISTEFGID